MSGRFTSGICVMLLLAGCSEYTSKPQSFLLPTSNKSIDTVLHRSDVRFLDCGTLTVIQTFDTAGQMIDRQSARGEALHCQVINTSIEAGSRIGSAAIVARGLVSASKATRPDVINNTNSQAQGQRQGQAQSQGQSQTVTGGEGGGSGGHDSHGNNGGGNGDGDGGNAGTGHHHDNGDNN